jgi:hypothetical protein
LEYNVEIAIDFGTGGEKDEGMTVGNWPISRGPAKGSGQAWKSSDTLTCGILRSSRGSEAAGHCLRGNGPSSAWDCQ